jgi:hypothetical protein
MNMKLQTPIILVLFILFGFTSCEKGPGEGGTSTITGKVIAREYTNNYTILRGIFPATKEDVYIIYGNDLNEIYGDQMKTDLNGKYEFNYLQKGKYIIYAYSDDTTLDYTASSQKLAVMTEVEITGKNQTVEASDLTIVRGSGEKGSSSITGKIIVREYNGDFSVLRDIYPGAKEDVYLIYGDDSNEVYDKDMETDWNGKYEFEDLPKGKYIVYAFSKDSTLTYTTSRKIAVLKNIEITENYQVVGVPDITIIK